MTKHNIDTRAKFQAVKYVKEALKQCQNISIKEFDNQPDSVEFSLYLKDPQVYGWLYDFFKAKGFKQLKIEPNEFQLSMSAALDELHPDVIDEIAFGGFRKEINEWFYDPDKINQCNYAVINGVKYKLVPVEE